MDAYSSASDDANKQYWEALAKSWQQLQQEQLEGYLDEIYHSLNDHHAALQAKMACSLEKHLQQLQQSMGKSSSLNLTNPDAQFNHISESSPAGQPPDSPNMQRHDTDLQSDVNQKMTHLTHHLKDVGRQITQVHLVQDVVKSLRGVIGWNPKTKTLQPQHSSNRSISGQIVPQDRLQAFFITLCHSFEFEMFAAFIVIANTVVIAVDADYSLQASLKTGKAEPVVPKIVDAIFAFAFLLELICRILAARSEFFQGRDRVWHAFDVIVVGVAMIELLFETINFSFIRILRVFRMMRVFRIIRVFRELRELRVMISSILVSFMTLVWAFVLLTLVIFLFCIIFVQGIAYYLDDHDDVPASVQVALEADFSSLSRGMYTLLATISGGREWAGIAEVFWEIHHIYFYIVVGYIVFALFGVLNVVTAVFVESAGNLSQVDKDLVLLTEMERQESNINQIESLFRALDTDRSGSLEWDELLAHLEDRRVQAYFANLNIDTSKAKSLFQLLDTDEDGSIAIEEFVLGCMRLKGMAKSIDIATMMYETKKQSVVNKASVQEIKEQLDSISKLVNKNTDAVHKNMHQIRENMLQVQKNTQILSSRQEEGIQNYKEINATKKDGREESRSQGAMPLFYSSSLASDKPHGSSSLSDLFHKEMSSIWR